MSLLVSLISVVDGLPHGCQAFSQLLLLDVTRTAGDERLIGEAHASNFDTDQQMIPLGHDVHHFQDAINRSNQN